MKTDQNEPETILQRLHSLDCLEKQDDRQIERFMLAWRHAVCQIYTKVFIWQELELSLDFLLLQIQP